mmetsp:Transcript_18583/g.26075  ORF Transcript_18583/g.26075 Transcript_18583/m.26075 type:complete len:308 (-) Transcript_18583:342-1265(-)|eukprot:CAMPEP_0175101466 /NCGR_PEP_ID=MMETSP0086_2-20121207/7816_1 /TAXON_ID=136419 /ORGANISM="Unknown Unknown, Strain D1" /LENGTH=307 /DNA_ID=CAMNT_0016376007 /DNA_START=30 /DNA_END=953 /DNA_ORIENTATION=+
MASPWVSLGAWAQDFPDAFNKMCEFTFKQADADGSGALEGDEVKALLDTLCKNSGMECLPEDEVKKYQGLIDADGDGKITLDEYKKFLTNIVTTKDSKKKDLQGAAAAYWGEAKLESAGGDAEKVAGLISDAENITSTQQKTILAKMLAKMGTAIDQQAFMNFVSTFGPLKDDGGKFVLAQRLAGEFADGGEVVGWFYGPKDCDKPEDMIKTSPVKSYLLRFASDFGGLTVNRTSEKGGKVMAAKSRLVNAGTNGWIDSLTKKHTPNIQSFLETYGPNGLDKMVHPLNSAKDKGAVLPSTYDTNFKQ